MLCSDRVKDAESLVQAFDAFTESERRKYFGHPKIAGMLEEYFTAKCLTDFWTFLSCVVYRNAMHHYYTPLHGPNPHGIATFLQDWTEEKNGVRVPLGEKFMIIAREHCKTQQCIAWLTWLIARDTNERIMIRSHKDEMAEAILEATVGVMEMADYRKRFPWVIPRGGWKANGKNGSKQRLMLERELEGIRTASLMRFGFGSDNTGEHFSTALYDDWETKDTACSDDLRPQLNAKYSLDDNVMMGGAKRLTTGTPYWINAYLHLAMQRKAQFADRSYGLLVQSCYVKVFDEPYVSREGQVELMDDRKTFRCMGAGFPTINANLTFHQAKVLFFSHAAKDFVTEIREVIWNDGEHFRVNRPFPRVLGDALRYEIGTERPACPNRMTVDSVDLDPNNKGLELDSSAPFIEVKQHVRESLVEKERRQGKTIFGCQMRLEPMNEADIVFDWNDVKEFSLTSLPQGERVWARTCDIAGPNKTAAHTAEMMGFKHETGYYIAHLDWGDPSPMEIILELCLGTLRVETLDPGHTLRWTSLEKAAREEWIKASLPMAAKDPQAFFAAAEGLKRYAKEFEGIYNMQIPIKELPGRKITCKGQRLMGMEPAWTKGEIYVAKELKHLDEFQDECVQFRPNITKGFDILDCLNDFVQGSRNFLVRKRDKKPVQAMGRFQEANSFTAAGTGPNMEWPG